MFVSVLRGLDYANDADHSQQLNGQFDLQFSCESHENYSLNPSSMTFAIF